MIPARRLALAATFWFAAGIQWSAIGVVLLPREVSDAVGEAHKGGALGVLLGAGALIALVLAPLIGSWSDRTLSRYGSRIPFIVAGGVLDVIVLAGFALRASLVPHGHGYASLVVAYLALHAAYNLVAAPLSAWVPDSVPTSQRGRAAGWIGLFRMVGTLAGGALGLLFASVGIAGAYIVLSLSTLAMLGPTVAGMRTDGATTAIEPPRAATARPSGRLAALWRLPSFRAVFLGRFAAMMGVFSVQSYLLYYLRDAVRDFRIGGHSFASSPEQAAGMFMVVMVVTAAAASPISGRASDSARRVTVIFASLALQAAAALTLVAMHSFAFVLGAAALFGGGFGAFQTASWVFATDTLPHESDHARDMGIWNGSLVLAQLVAAPCAGILLDAFTRWGRQIARPQLGYSALFASAALCFVAAAIAFRSPRA